MDNIVANCFHGKLDRQTAEDRLSQAAQQGSFLLRESERKTGSYVLSYLGHNGINHFRITHSYGSYFIGGRQFDSLADLITHYSTDSNLYTDERLVYPVQPLEPIKPKERLFISILPYTKLAQSDELSFNKGDIFVFQDDLGDGWFWCRDFKTGQSGLVFSQLVEELQDDIDPNEIFPWFHSRLSKVDAVDKLAQAGPGSFLIRPSDNSPGNYTLFYHVGPTVQRFLIVRDSENRYLMGGRFFDSLGQVVELYKREPIMEGHVLQYPITTTMSRADQLRERTLSTSMRALEIRDKPQDIYNTVKISREVSRQKQNSELRGWLGMKKGDMQKKWKNYFFVLNSRDNHLYFYEKPQQTKPKGMIDLTYSFFYKMHDSIFDWPQCFQIAERCLPCFANHFYFRCDDDHMEFEKWARNLAEYTAINQATKKSLDSSKAPRKDATFNVVSKNTFDERRSMIMDMVEVHSLKLSQPYFVIAYNRDIKVAKSQVKSTPSAVFGEDGHFVLENLPSDVNSITILIQQSGKKPKAPSELPQFSIDLASLKANEQTDKWYKFLNDHSHDVVGCLRVKLVYCSEVIMNLTEYAGLEDLLSDPNLEVLTLFNQFEHRDHLVLSRALINILRHTNISVHILKALIEREIATVSDSSALFQTSTFTTAIVESYLRTMCQKALNKCLKASFKRMLDDKICCEINLAKLDSQNLSQKACESFEVLLDIMDELICNIYDSIPCYPTQVRYLFAHLQHLVKRKWPNETLTRTRAIGSLLFLRLICPSIINPKQFNLINETPSENAIRNLTLVTKCIQNVASLTDTSKSNNSLAHPILATLDDYAMYPLNQIRLNDQDDYATQSNSILAFILSPQIELWMDVVNPFILKNKIGMVKFIDELCNVEVDDTTFRDDAIDGNNNFGLNQAPCLGGDRSHDLATVHDVCELYHNDLEHQASASNGARKLVATLSILSKHKQYYDNLRRAVIGRNNKQLV